MAKYVHRMPFWNFLAYVLTPIAAIGEAAIVKFDGHWFFHGVVVVGFIMAAWIKFNIKDEDNNGIADTFEK
jgi:hypothetical protein